MKKLLTIVISITLGLTMAACSSESATTSIDFSTEQVTSTTEESAVSEDTTPIETVTLEEIVVVDNEECLITITGIDPNSMWGYTVNVYLENKSIDKTYMYAVQTAAINGVAITPIFATEVAAGKKSNSEIILSTTDLAANGITEFTDIELSFRVYDSNDWLADEVALETVHVYPYGAENATVFSRESQTSDTILIDNDSVTVIVTGYDEDNIWGYTANLFLVNKTDTEVMFSVSEASVNGYMIDPFFAKSIGATKCAFTSVSWSNTSLSENNITEVEELAFLLRAYNFMDFMSDDFANEVITLNP